MDFSNYENKLPFPSDVYKFFFYSEGRTIFETTNPDAALAYSRKYPHILYEKVKINRAEIATAREAYYENEKVLFEAFKTDLLREFGVENIPAAQKVFNKAWERGHAYGFAEVYAIFDDLVEIIL